LGKITSKEFQLAVAIALMGFVLTSRQWILWLNGLTIVGGFLVYYALLYGALYVLEQMGLVIFGFKIKDPKQTIGLLLISFAFFAIVNWENPYIQYVTMGNFSGASGVFYMTEDGLLWQFTTQLLPSADVELHRIFAFVIMPFLIALLGVTLVSKKIQLQSI